MALKTTYGFRDEEDYNNTDLIICWGGNPFASLRPGAYMCYGKHGNASPILDAKARGAKLIVIDPIFTETAAKADQFIPIKPSTDGALANAMANTIIAEDLYDHEFVEQWCHGFDEYRACMEQYTPEWAEPITGVPADTIRELARLYATTERAALHEGNSLALHSNCVQAVRSIGCLRAICGKLDKEGCNVCFPTVVGHPVAVENGNPTGIKTTVKVEAPNVNAERYPLFLNGLPGALMPSKPASHTHPERATTPTPSWLRGLPPQSHLPEPRFRLLHRAVHDRNLQPTGRCSAARRVLGRAL